MKETHSKSNLLFGFHRMNHLGNYPMDPSDTKDDALVFTNMLTHSLDMQISP